jgi:hypothetical protein
MPKHCEEITDRIRCTKYAVHGGILYRCVTHGGGKRCTEDGCDKSSQGKSDKCVRHGGGKRCTEDGCDNSAVGKSDKCVTHGGGKRCTEDGCDKGAVGKIDKCVTHGGGKRCTEDGCDKSARGKSDKCVTHGGGKRCTEDGCDKSAVGKSDKCVTHGGGKRCTEDGCDNSAVGKSDKCVTHGGGNRCKCQESTAYFALEGEVAICCSRCKTDDMIDVRNPRCRANEEPWGILCPSGANRYYDRFCGRCFTYLFPENVKSMGYRKKSKELSVQQFVNYAFPGLFTWNKPIHYGLGGVTDCPSRRRLDFHTVIGNTVFSIEVDENQHVSYNTTCEENRNNEIFTEWGGKLVLIRYNPDKYRDSNGNVKNPSIVKRTEILKREVEKQMSRISGGNNSDLYEQVYLFYNGYESV